MPLTVLMVAEKPSLAESIAKILSDGRYRSRKGISPACSVHEYDGVFQGKAAKFKVTSVAGHVFTIDFPKEYNNWDVIDPVDLFNAPIQKLEANPKTYIPKHLANEAKNIDVLVLWLDCDREGENICYEVMKCTKIHLNTGGGLKRERIYRARFSAITPLEIKKAMEKLGTPNENEAKAVDVRQELDLKVGCAFTRFQTRYFQGKYGNLDSSCVSFGPCQTPTLALCVKRHDEILSFVPEPFWSLSAKISVGTSMLTFTSDRGRIFDQKKANVVKEQLKNAKTARVIKVSNEKKTLQRPHALNTVEMLKAASSGLGMSPQETMHVAERLYISGYISYPRTETSKYPKSFDLRSVVEMQKSHPYWGDAAQTLLQTGFSMPEGGHDAGDHPPITPTRMAAEGELTGDNWRLYDYITRHFLGTLSPNCQYMRTKVIVEIGTSGEKFIWAGNRVREPGFTSVMHWKTMTDDDTGLLERDVKEGDSLNVADVSLKEGQTSPPDYLTESELISMMEKLGIGTDASMAVHIANICARRYVQVSGNSRMLIPTNLGIVVVHGLQKIDPELADPK
ncbi:DNA topoisomerase 3-beta-1 [Quaeritorhiza haematococci]|nr:DNA topoisomerase 3-beta-1 [Quaeritorhiza haematococci]